MMSMMTEIQEDTRKWKCNSCQDPNGIFHRNRINNPKMCLEPQRPQIAKAPPLFAVARMAGWGAHRMEELTSGNKLIRPRYECVEGFRNYIPMENR